MASARQQQRVDQAIARHQAFAGTFQFGVEEAQVEHGVVRDQGRIADEGEKLVGDLGEQRLVLELVGRDAVDGLRLGRHVAFRIDVVVEALPARDAVDDLDAADLDQAVSLEGIKARGLGIEHDLAQAIPPSATIEARSSPRITVASAL